MPNRSEPEPGRLLARGRAADVYELDDRRVLRRYRGAAPFATEREAKLIEHVRAYGFPTPAVYEVTATDLVLERVTGDTMADDMTRRPWTIARRIGELAALHDTLHAIPAPDWLEHEPMGSGASVVHLDLHPLNVLLASTGPTVIDWTNAGRGAGGADVALTWLLLRTGVPDDNNVMRIAAAVAGRYIARRFAASADPSGETLAQYLHAATRYRLADPNLRDAERRAIRRLLAGAS
jgi:aminoglycoside phosphotransferase (APT) family kinase protein